MLYAGFGKHVYTAFATIGGNAVGFVATGETLCHNCVAKASRFVRLCDAFSVPVQTIVNTNGFAPSATDDIAGGIREAARLAATYADATTAKVALLSGKAVGPVYTALANADLKIAVNGCTVSALEPNAAVSVLYKAEIDASDNIIAATNANDIFFNYLQTGEYKPMPSRQTIANAMDVGDPSNFARIYDLYHGSYEKIKSMISGATYSDSQIRTTMKDCYDKHGYVLDPHGACGYQALVDLLEDGETGVFCETAHPAKFKETVENAINAEIEIPERLAEFMKGTKKSVPMTNQFDDFKAFLMKE